MLNKHPVLVATFAWYAVLLVVFDLTGSFRVPCPEPQSTAQQQAANDGKEESCGSPHSFIVKSAIGAFHITHTYEKELVAGGTVLLAFVTICLVIYTARLWGSTKTLVDNADKTAIAQLRAYVFPEAAMLWDGSTLTPQIPARINFPGIVFSWRNTGQTPAMDVICWGRIAIIKPSNEDLLIPATILPKFSNHLGHNQLGNKNLWYRRALSPQARSQILTGQLAIYLYGRIEYQDIFKNQRWANFRLHYTGMFPPAARGGVFSYSEKGNNHSD